MTLKTIGTTQYITYIFDTVKKWSWTKGMYFVHPSAEQEFIAYIRHNESLQQLRELRDILSFFISGLTFASSEYLRII